MELAGQMIRVLGALSLVLALLFLGLYGLRRTGILKRLGQDSNPIAIAAQRPIDSKHRLLIVQIEDQRFLFGISPQGIQRLGRLPKAPALAPPAVAVDRP